MLFENFMDHRIEAVLVLRDGDVLAFCQLVMEKI